MKQRCSNCKYFRPCEDNPKRGECVNPERNDDVMVHYFGSLKENDYCALYEGRSKAVHSDEGE